MSIWVEETKGSSLISKLAGGCKDKLVERRAGIIHNKQIRVGAKRILPREKALRQRAHLRAHPNPWSFEFNLAHSKKIQAISFHSPRFRTSHHKTTLQNSLVTLPSTSMLSSRRHPSICPSSQLGGNAAYSLTFVLYAHIYTLLSSKVSNKETLLVGGLLT